MKKDANDDGVTSVVGEMLIIGLVVILVSLFAVSAFNLLPDGRESTAVVTMTYDSGTQNLSFYHKGGDWVKGNELIVRINSIEENITAVNLKDWQENPADVFDLGGCYTVQLEKPLVAGSEVRLVAGTSVIYSGRYEP